MIQFDFVPFHKVAPEVMAYLPKLKTELTDEYDPVEIDWKYYLEASHLGSVFLITARDNGKLVGHAAFHVTNDPNHKQKIVASNINIYVAQEYRGRIGLELIDNATACLKAVGCQEITYTLKDKKIGRLLSMKGFKPDYTVWGIKL